MTLSLKAARINKGLSQEEAALKIGISVFTLANYESGKTFPDVQKLKIIERIYEIEYKDLFFSVDNTVKPYSNEETGSVS